MSTILKKCGLSSFLMRILGVTRKPGRNNRKFLSSPSGPLHGLLAVRVLFGSPHPPAVGTSSPTLFDLAYVKEVGEEQPNTRLEEVKNMRRRNELMDKLRVRILQDRRDGLTSEQIQVRRGASSRTIANLVKGKDPRRFCIRCGETDPQKLEQHHPDGLPALSFYFQ